MAPASSSITSIPAIRFMLAAKRLRVRDLEQLVTVCGLVGAISALIHFLQRERGISNVYLGSRGQEFAERLKVASADSGRAEQTLRSLFDVFEASAPTTSFAPRVFGRIAYALHALDALEGIRHRVAALKVNPEDATKFFVDVIAGLLAVVFEASDTNADPTISRALVAMFNFMQGKEFAGQERATTAAGFSAGRFTTAQHQRLLKLIDAQARSFQIFAQFAELGLVSQFEQVMEAPERTEFAHLRQAAVAAGPDRELRGLSSRTWFDHATTRLDAMYAVEVRIDADLQDLCAAKLGEARADLEDHDAHVSLPHPDQGESAPTVYVIGQADQGLIADAAKSGMNVLSADGISPKLGRSLVDLVQTQFRHLQQVTEELETARLAINERKVIDKAKGLLMTHRGLTEQQAYDLLRKTAMSQNRRIKEVADSIIAMADILIP